jgi:hypothetical protein
MEPYGVRTADADCEIETSAPPADGTSHRRASFPERAAPEFGLTVKVTVRGPNLKYALQHGLTGA